MKLLTLLLLPLLVACDGYIHRVNLIKTNPNTSFLDIYKEDIATLESTLYTFESCVKNNQSQPDYQILWFTCKRRNGTLQVIAKAKPDENIEIQLIDFPQRGQSSLSKEIENKIKSKYDVNSAP